MLQKIQVHPRVLEEQTSLEEVQSAKPGPGSQIGAVCPCEKEVKAIHSFNTCPKAPHGTGLTCTNMLQKRQVHPRVLEEQTSLNEVQSDKPGPGGQIGAVCPCEKEVKAIHSFNICPKAPHGAYLTSQQMLQQIQVHPRVLEEQTYIEEAQSANPGPGSQTAAVCPREKEVKAIHSFNICPKAPHGFWLTCTNMLRKIQVHPKVLEEQTSIKEGQSAKIGPGSQVGAVCEHEKEENDIHSDK